MITAKNSIIYSAAVWIFALLFAGLSINANAQSNLLYWEAQGVGAYSLNNDAFYPYSHHAEDVMQKPSIGFDYVGRLRSKGSDWGYLAVQGRLAYSEGNKYNIQPQLYNAYFNYKAKKGDIWLGHNKPAFGLSSYLDNHALLMSDNSMSGLVFDRDWGIGYALLTSNNDYKVSLTTGSGMPFYMQDNYLLSGRMGFDDLLKYNRTYGISFSYGSILKTMGYEIMHGNRVHELFAGGIDFSWRYLDIYLNSDAIAGIYDEERVYAGLMRLGRFLLPEERLSVEIQANLLEIKGNADQYYSMGLNYRINPYFTARALYTHHQPGKHDKLVLQLYYYRGVVL